MKKLIMISMVALPIAAFADDALPVNTLDPVNAPLVVENMESDQPADAQQAGDQAQNNDSRGHHQRGKNQDNLGSVVSQEAQKLQQSMGQDGKLGAAVSEQRRKRKGRDNQNAVVDPLAVSADAAALQGGDRHGDGEGRDSRGGDSGSRHGSGH